MLGDAEREERALHEDRRVERLRQRHVGAPRDPALPPVLARVFL